jgi:hypothetical protein
MQPDVWKWLRALRLNALRKYAISRQKVPFFFALSVVRGAVPIFKTWMRNGLSDYAIADRGRFSPAAPGRDKQKSLAAVDDLLLREGCCEDHALTASGASSSMG